MQEMTGELESAVATRDQQKELFQKMGDKVREGLCSLKTAEMWSKALPFSTANMDQATAAAATAQGTFQDAEDKGGEAAALQLIAEICLSRGLGSKAKQPSKAL